MSESAAWLAIILSIFLLKPAAAYAKNPNQGAPAMDATLQEARSALDNSNLDQAKLKQVIAELEKQQPKHPKDMRYPLYLSEAYYKMADPEANVDKEFPYYEKTEKYAKQALVLDPNNVEAHYWNGLFLLKKAQKQGGISAYSTVKEGVAELEKVRSAIPAYDHAGASRVLGLMYMTAPGFTPFGNVKKGVEMMQEATRLAPDFLLNRLYLGNAYKKSGDKNAAIREYREVVSAAANTPGEEAKKSSDEASKQLRELGVSAAAPAAQTPQEPTKAPEEPSKTPEGATKAPQEPNQK